MYPIILSNKPNLNEKLDVNLRFKCYICSKIINEIENIGVWDCTFHPGDVVIDHNKKSILSCCALEYKCYYLVNGVDLNTGNIIDISNLYGCTSCDHINGDYKINDSNDIDFDNNDDILDYILDNPNNINYLYTNGVKIRRYDNRLLNNITNKDKIKYESSLKYQIETRNYLELFSKDIEQALNGKKEEFKQNFKDAIHTKKKEFFKKKGITIK